MPTNSFIFYSDRCPNCSKLIETLKAFNKMNLYKFYRVEDIPRDKIPPYLKAVPTLYNPETKQLLVSLSQILGEISKPSDARSDVPVKEVQAKDNLTAADSLEPWNFTGKNMLTEAFSMWNQNPNAPAEFSVTDSGLYTSWAQGITPEQPRNMQGAGQAAPSSQNTMGGKGSAQSEIDQRMKAMESERKNSFAAVSRK